MQFINRNRHPVNILDAQGRDLILIPGQIVEGENFKRFLIPYGPLSAVEESFRAPAPVAAAVVEPPVPAVPAPAAVEPEIAGGPSADGVL